VRDVQIEGAARRQGTSEMNMASGSAGAVAEARGFSSFLPIASTLLLYLSFGNVASAESVTLVQNEYMPLVGTKNGRVEMCGIHFSSVVMTLDQRPMGIQGSINTTYYKDRFPGLIIKIAIVEDKDGKLSRRKAFFTSFRVGLKDTKAMKSVPGEDGNSLLLITDMSQTGDFFSTFPNLFLTGAWVSFSLDPSKGDYTYRLPPIGKQDADTMKQLNECNVIGLDNAAKELGIKAPR
jgi:hypothetical protein